MGKRYWPGIVLIFIGVLLLLDEAAMVSLRWADFFSYGLILIGVTMLVNGLERPEKKGVLGGTFFLCFGIMLALMRNRILIRDDEFGAAIFFLSLALANLVYFMVKGYRWSNFTWAIIFAVVGGLVLISYYGYYPSWYIYELIESYWPVILILLGVTILLRGLKKQNALTS
jgi:hypothetical protein